MAILSAISHLPAQETQANGKPLDSNPTNLPTIEVAEATMVTVDLDLGTPVPNIATALDQIERRSEPDDHVGRTFAILEAYGQPTSDGKLHLSMHVSTEKPGIGSLVLRRTGETLWKNRIVPATHSPASSFAGKNLLIMVADDKDKAYLLNGSNHSPSLLDATVRDLGVTVRDFWPDGAVREVTIFYSACGCPVKVEAKRNGERLLRTKELPVIFPDDPAVVATIARLTGWP